MVNQTLVIVESPGKIKKINAILGKDYLVKASVGHIRDLESSKLSIDVNNDFKPTYIVSKDKKQVVSDLKNCVKKCNDVILAADEDREGEAIAASLAEVLKLKDPKRIVFNEITKDAIESAIRNPGKINYNLVRAQETRRFLDRIVGFKLSPLLWKNVMNKLSAGRVQSVVVKLIIEKEDSILNLEKESYFKISGIFHSLDNKSNKLSGVLYEMDKSKKSKGYLLKLTDKSKVEKLMTILDKSKYEVKLIENKISKRNPQPPFITSTLQQEANKKFNFTIKSTMNIAQKLYEGGHITYMRTDSTNLSDEALKSCEKYIKSNFGSKYYYKRKYNSKSKNAQEAHEAIRPTKLDKDSIVGSAEEKKLYSLIWKRTIASQMSSAEISVNSIYVEIMHNNLLPYYFLSTNESIKFEGFLKVYNMESEELSKCNINFKEKDKLEYDEMLAKEEFTKGIGRYNEATLVKKLEELSIGRPSTYASIINDITVEKVFKVKSETSNNIYNIMIVNGKISTVNKINGFDSFINSTNNQNRIFIGNNISQKAFKQFLEKKNSEVFFEKDLMVDIIKHKYQPKFKLLTEEEKQQKLKDYNIESKFESKMLSTDIVARYFNAKAGDIFRIKRPSTFSGESFHYRLVVESPISVIFE